MKSLDIKTDYENSCGGRKEGRIGGGGGGRGKRREGGKKREMQQENDEDDEAKETWKMFK